MPNKIAEKLGFMLRPKRIKVAYGGRGGAKTYSFVKIAIALALKNSIKVLCLREFMNSIEDSVHSALSREIIEKDLEKYFNIKATAIDGINGSKFRYAQLARNLASLKSKDNFDIAWVEEAETVTDKSLDFLIPTIRKSNSEIWLSFNPTDDDGAVYSRFVKPNLSEIEANGFYEDDNLIVVKVGLDDNPFATEELLKDSENMKKQNYKKWLHIYGGECFGDYEDSVIQPEWFDSAIDAHKKLGFNAQGVISTGFDPADTGGDNKAIVTRWGSVVTQVKSWHKGDIEEAIDKAFSYAFDARSDHIVYDSVGVGAAIKVGLDKRILGKHIVVDPFGGGETPDNPVQQYKNNKANKDVFKNKRAQYWWYLRDRLEATYLAVEKGVYSNPEDLISFDSSLIDKETLAGLKSELIKVQRKRTRSGSDLIQLESKVEMKSRNVKSPGMADALVMSFANSLPFSSMHYNEELIPEYVEDY